MTRLAPEQVARALVAAGFEDYVLWSDGASSYAVAAGVRARIVVEANTIRVRDGAEKVIVEATTRDPFADLAGVLARALSGPYRAWGYLGFGLAGFRYAYRKARATELHLIVPQVTCTYGASGISFEGAHDATARARAAVTAFASEPAADAATDAGATRDDAVAGGRAEYEAAVREVLAALEADQMEKVILSRRVTISGRLNALATYAASAQTQAARRFAFALGGVHGVGACPEILLVADAAGHVVTNPLAGTQPRGRTDEEDGRLRARLLRDAKEVSEHAMSIRLAYDEIASVCTPESARVIDFMQVKRYPFTQHLSSRAAGTLARGRTTWDALGAVFPGVTVSGIAKREAIATIDRLEPVARGVYGGAVGWVDHTGAMDWGIAIRSAFDYGEGNVALNAGAGIVRDSDPAYEFDESAHKMQTMASRLVLEAPPRATRPA